MYEQPYRQYWRVLYPEFSDTKATAYWYGRWKTAEMAMGLFDDRRLSARLSLRLTHLAALRVLPSSGCAKSLAPS